MADSRAIQIYIGCTEHQLLVARVLEWSIRARTAREVACYPLYQYARDFQMPVDPENRPGTPFSFHRFMIPEIAGFTGRAIYMDCDQLVFKDVARLHDRPMGQAPVLCCNTKRKRKIKPTKRSSMMLLDCERLDWQIAQIIGDLNAHRYSYESLFSLDDFPHTLPNIWNSLDSYRWPFTALLHLTDKKRQPWIHYRHELGRLWTKELFAALSGGFIKRDAVADAVDRQLVRPSLLHQVDHGIVDPRKLSDAVKAKDQPFIDACAANNFNNVPGDYAEHTDEAPGIAARSTG